MNPGEILGECLAHGVTVYLSDGRIKVRGDTEAVNRYAPMLRSHKDEIADYLAAQRTKELLAQFRLHDCGDDPEPELIARINNVTWRLITAQGFPFDEAIAAAATWAIANPPHRDEAAFIDVMGLFKGMAGL